MRGTGKDPCALRRVPLACALAWLLAPGCAPSKAPRPDGIVLVVLDTLRADRLALYGHSRPTSPALDALAARGAVFEDVITNASWTLPALAGLLSARFPTREVFDRRLKTSLVERLEAAGWATAAFTEGGYFSKAFGLDRGFATYREEESAIRLTLRGEAYHESADGSIEKTFALAEQWLAQRDGSPFFLVVHTYEVHTPYRRGKYTTGLERGVLDETLEQSHVARIRAGELALGETERSYLAALYDGGVHRADRHVGELLAALERLGLAATTAVVVTSDHGEEFGDRVADYAGDHGHSLYDELVRVPLVLYNPLETYPVRRVAQQVRTIDILPTLLDLAGLPVVDGSDGRSLLPLLRGEQREARPAYAETHKFPPGRLALRRGGHKLIVRLPASRDAAAVFELYDLERDPGERSDLARERPQLLAEMEAELRTLVTRFEKAGRADYRSPRETPREVIERLESLGYVEP